MPQGPMTVTSRQLAAMSQRLRSHAQSATHAGQYDHRFYEQEDGRQSRVSRSPSRIPF